MGAIAGILSREADLVDRCNTMLKAMRARGPDGSHVYHESAMAVGYASLCTTPESLNESMPWKDQTRGVVIAADLRLDNREELIRTLKVPAAVPDSRLVASAYAKWGVDCIRHLLGDFAFAIWDCAHQKLFCARDHFGLRPFYYATRNSHLAFASTVAGVLASGLLPRRIHEPRIADYLSEYLEGIDETVTFYEDVSRLPPAHYLVAERGKVKIGRYWTLEPQQSPVRLSDDEYAEGFKSALEQAVGSRLRTHGDPGAMLSGGLDSSSIVCVSKELVAHEKLHTFSAISNEWETSRTESRAIEAVVSLGGICSHTITPAYLDGNSQWLENMLRQTDDLFDSTSLCIPWLMYREASRSNVSAVLDGLDGDRVFWLSNGCAQYLMAKGRSFSAIRAARSYARFYEESLAVTLTRSMRSALRLWAQPLYDRMATNRRARQCRDESNRICQESLMLAEFAQGVGLPDRIDRYNGTIPQTIDELHAKAVTSPVVTAALERYGRVAAAHSIEARTPIYDKRLVEFCLSLPWQQKALGGLSKPIIRNAMKGQLPESVLQRKNWESVGPDYWWRWWQASRDLVDYAINDCLDTVQNFVDTDRLRQLYSTCDTHRDTDWDWGGSPHATVFHIALLALWLTYQKESDRSRMI